MSCFVFRISEDDKEWIFKEIKKGFLRQGWGIPGTALILNNRQINSDEWIKNYKENAFKEWGEDISDDIAAKRYKVLIVMLNIQKDDILIIPKIPEKHTFTICKSTGNYFFDVLEAKDRDNYNDFRHVIPIDKDNIKIFSYSSSIESKYIKGKFRAYQSPVNKVANKEFITKVNSLYQKDSDLSIKNINELIYELKPEIYNHFLPKIIDLGHREVEEIVTEIFKNAGYEIEDTHVYDSEGGDADIIVSTKIPIVSESFDDFGQKIYIQIKTKKDDDWYDEEGVDQLIKISKNDPESLKILISTAPKFSEKCKTKASANDVMLISGIQLMPLIIKYIS